MFLVDANLFIYAYNPDDPAHAKARVWVEGILGGIDPVGLPWATILAFVRIGTNPRAFERPLALGEAIAIVNQWMARPVVRIIEPTDRHWEILSDLLPKAQARGNLVTDAHLAALAIEHGATLCSTDRDFARFPGLRWENPIA